MAKKLDDYSFANFRKQQTAGQTGKSSQSSLAGQFGKKKSDEDWANSGLSFADYQQNKSNELATWWQNAAQNYYSSVNPDAKWRNGETSRQSQIDQTNALIQQAETYKNYFKNDQSATDTFDQIQQQLESSKQIFQNSPISHNESDYSDTQSSWLDSVKDYLGLTAKGLDEGTAGREARLENDANLSSKYLTEYQSLTADEQKVMQLYFNGGREVANDPVFQELNEKYSTDEMRQMVYAATEETWKGYKEWAQDKATSLAQSDVPVLPWLAAHVGGTLVDGAVAVGSLSDRIENAVNRYTLGYQSDSQNFYGSIGSDYKQAFDTERKTKRADDAVGNLDKYNQLTDEEKEALDLWMNDSWYEWVSPEDEADGMVKDPRQVLEEKYGEDELMEMATAMNALKDEQTLQDAGLSSTPGADEESIVRKAANVGYDALSSAVDSTTGVTVDLLTGLPLYTLAMGASAAQQSANEYASQGISIIQGSIAAAMNGVIEAWTEGGTVNRLEDAIFRHGGNLWKSFASEGFEEGLGDILKNLMEAVVLGKDSKLNQQVQAYRSQGMELNKAQWQVVKDAAKEMGYDAFVGGLSGVFGTEIGYAENAVFQKMFQSSFDQAVEKAAAKASKDNLPKNAQNPVQNAQNGAENVQNQPVSAQNTTENAQPVAENAQPTAEETAINAWQAVDNQRAQEKQQAENSVESETDQSYNDSEDVAWTERPEYDRIYDMGQSGVSLATALRNKGSLTESQVRLAYQAGQEAASEAAKKKVSTNASDVNGKVGWRKGSIKAEGITLDELQSTFNDTQKTAYKLLNFYAEATGVDIVLYQSQQDENGNFTGAQGRYSQSNPGTIYIDVNSGLKNGNSITDLASYTMMRTFGHEFTHFGENWSAEDYNELRAAVFEAMEQRGEDANDLIETYLSQHEGATYDQASREVVAEALTDILQDSNFIQQTAATRPGIFQKILSMLKEFTNKLRQHFQSMGTSTNRGAAAVREQVGDTLKYLDDIVKKYDKMAANAVKNYQRTVAEDVRDNRTERQNREELEDTEYVKPEAKQETKQEQAEETKAEESKEESEPKQEESAVDGDDYDPAIYMSDNGYVVMVNKTTGNLEITLGQNPIAEAKAVLQGNGFAWSDQKSAWVGKGNFKYMSMVLDNAFDVHNQKLNEPVRAEPETKEPEAKAEEPAAAAAHEPYTSENGYTMTVNEKGKINITFDGKPSEAIRNVLKDNKFRWAPYAKAWYGDGDFDTIRNLLDAAYQQEQKPAAEQKQKTPYDSVNEWLSAGQDDVFINGLRFKITKSANGNGYIGSIRRDNGSSIENGRSLYTSTTYGMREDAVSELIVVAARNRLLGDDIPESLRRSFERMDAERAEEQRREEEFQKTQQAAEEEDSYKDLTASEKLADSLLSEYLTPENIASGKKKLTSKDLYALADKAFGGTQAEGAYNRKDAYDAMELAVNKYLLKYANLQSDIFNGNAKSAVKAEQFLLQLMDILPTQTVRTQEQQDFQQFSTPPNIAYLAAWAANIQEGDSMMEPSAGIGGLALWAKAWGATVTANELSPRRLEVLRSMGFDNLYNENAEQIDNILPDNIQPNVVVMNPPFSSTAGRTKSNKTSNAERHIDQALSRLQEGGRLVAILGKGMNNADYARYWNKLRQNYTIRANIGIDGENYKKYGTTWGVQLVVIDKIGAQTGETLTGTYKDLTEIPGVLEGIRNARELSTDNSTSDRELQQLPVERGTDSLAESVSEGQPERVGGDAATDVRTGVNEDIVPKSGNETASGGSKQREGNGTAKTDTRKTGNDQSGQRGNTGSSRGTDVHDNGERKRGGNLVHVLSTPNVEPVAKEAGDDGVYSTFKTPELTTTGSKKHPAVLVESAAMAAIDMPKATYVPSLPEDVVKNNLSDAQMVSITYAGQAHEQKLPNGSRKGFFIGDGTGVGKGRQIAGIILDNFMQGRKKAVWVSMNDSLLVDAQRDWTATTGRDKNEVVLQSKTKISNNIAMDEGILFTTYGTVRTESGGKSRLDQLVSWLGKDFDGVIAFDEAQNMNNVLGKTGKFGKSKGSATAQKALELQRALPNARIVYVSATGATDVSQLAFLDRLGLWGQGTAFTDAKDFVTKIGASGLAAMELVVRDMKAMGSYVARSISYNGVNYDTVEQKLDPVQTEIYNTMSRAWQVTLQNIGKALETTGAKNNSNARRSAQSAFYGALQRFYNQVLTSMATPAVIADMRKELAAGRSCVIQLVGTNEAQLNRALADAKANGIELEDLDMTPREALLGYLQKSFPVQMYEEYTDENGDIQSRPVFNSKGEPVLDKNAVKMRDAMIAQVEQMSIPDGPIDMIIDAFGAENVAENTGRSRRLVNKKMENGSIKRIEERRSPKSRATDVDAFQNGDKRIMIFSDAGGTGKSYHADLSERNQQQRVHYVLQPGWQADKAVQGFGRTHRSNEANAPIYKLVTTDIKGQKRFTSTIARRLDQLGALTKGQRNTGSGMFSAADNLENDLAKDSLAEFYQRLGKNQIEGIDAWKTLERLGLKNDFSNEWGGFKMNDSVGRDISRFLNRILALEVDEQNKLFDAFTSIYEMELEAAIQAGTLDTGMENVKADKVEIVDDTVIRKDENGADTHYLQVKTYNKTKPVTTVDEMSKMRAGFVGLYELENGAVRAVYRIADKTTEWGSIQKQYVLMSPNTSGSRSTWVESTLNSRAKLLPADQWQTRWESEVAKVPQYNESTMHMLTGALLPIWNNLPTEGNTKVKRLIDSDGNVHLGRVIDKSAIDSVLSRFNTSRTMETYTPKSVMEKVLQGGAQFFLQNNRAVLERRMVSGEYRLELKQLNNWALERQYPGIIHEKIQWTDRYFIPTGAKGEAILEKLLQDNPVRDVSEGTQEQERVSPLTDREVLQQAAAAIDESGYTDGEKEALRIFNKRLENLQKLEQQRQDLGKLYREQQFGKNVDRAAAKETLNRMHVLDGQIERANNELLDVEQKSVLRNILHQAREMITEQERQRGADNLKKWRERRKEADAVKKYRKRLQKDVKSLTDWITHPDNKNVLKHVPDVIKNPVIQFLTSIDMTSKRQLKGGAATKADQEFIKTLQKLESAMKTNFNAEGQYSGYNDLPSNFLEKLTAMQQAVTNALDANADTYVVNRMNADELHNLAEIVHDLKNYIQKMNQFHENAMFQHAYEAGDNTINTLRGMRDNKNRAGKINDFLFWQQMRPAYIFERFGEAGRSIFLELAKGQDKLAHNAKAIADFAEKAYTTQEVNAWEKETISVTLESGDKISMPVAMAMSFYCLQNRPQALTHMMGQGIRVASFKNGKQVISDVGHALTPSDIAQISNSLTDRQKEVAKNLQQYMAKQGGEWGNYVTMARFGEEQFGEETYFPINVDGRALSAKTDAAPAAADLYALLNASFTKELKENANNRIVLYSIFDVFSNHMTSMAQYNALALPILDTLKWFNYRQTTVDEEGHKEVLDSVRDEMARAYGAPVSKDGREGQSYAERFVTHIIQGFNSTEAQGSYYDTTGMSALHRFNRAQIAYNMRVVLQQPMAITRARIYLGATSTWRSFFELNPMERKRNVDEMLKYSGIAQWKDLGFYDVNISRGMTQVIKHAETFSDKVMEVGTWGAEQADRYTWAAMWAACKSQISKKTNLEKGSEEYFKAVTDLFEEVIYKTQVVDGILTKNEFMRDKGLFARTTGSFMSEPTTTASMLLDTIDKYNQDIAKGMSTQDAWKKHGKTFAKTAYVYTMGNLVLAAVQAIADAWRDDDDYETFFEKWLEAFKGNFIDEMNPLSKLPIVNDFVELAKELGSTIFDWDTYGNSPSSIYMQWYDTLIKGVEIIKALVEDDPKNKYTWYGAIRKLLQAVSGGTGMPLATATREVVDFWNNTVGRMAPSMKVRTYDAGNKNRIKYAYLDGYLTEEESIAELTEMGIADDENEAYFLLQGWDQGSTTESKWLTLNAAIKSGGDLAEAKADLIAHGVTEKEVDSHIKQTVGEQYKDGKITKVQAESYLKGLGLDSTTITSTVNKWSSAVVTGISYEDIGDSYKNGDIDAARAIQMYQTYGGLSRTDARAKVAYLTFQRDYPEYGWTQSQYEKYTNKAKSNGVSMDVYNKYLNAKSGATKKEEVLKVINGLSISSSQKDALYRTEGYAESTLKDAPWH